jgi:hypothetical protein
MDSPMNKLLSALALTGLVAIGTGIYVNAAMVSAASEDPRACETREVVVDEGYGVTTTEWREICGKISAAALVPQ